MKKLENYKGQKIAVNCTTPEQAEAFCKLMHENGLTWIYGDSYLKNTYFENFKEKTCYDFNHGGHQNLEWYVENGYTILPATDFLEEEFIYGQEYEFSDNKDFKYVNIKRYLCKRPDGKFLAWDDILNCNFTYNYARKINTERTEAIATIKELVSKFSISQNEVF